MRLLARSCLVLAVAICASALAFHGEAGADPVALRKDDHDATSSSFEVEQLEGGGLLIGRGNVLAGAGGHASMLVQLTVPLFALGVGGLGYALGPQFRTLAQLLLFFGAQAFMNLYMKSILSNREVSTELHMRGLQAPLALTGLQQLVGFFVLLAMVGVSQLTPWAYKPRRLENQEEVFAVLALSVCFTLNIALNNFSLSLVDMSVNVMIRSASPLTSLLLQLMFWRWFKDDSIDMRPVKVFLMLLGVVFALCVVFAKYSGVGLSASAQSTGSTLGLALCVASLAFSSMELIVVVILGRGFKLNPVDTLLYMALPVFVLLLLPSFFLKHPVAYPGHPASTDWGVLREVARLSPGTLVLSGLSGVWALGYNLLLYNMVRDLSPYFASFAANFNKVASIGLALVMGLEDLPHGGWKFLMVVGVLGNMASFTAYSLWSSQPAPSMVDVAKAKLGGRGCFQQKGKDPEAPAPTK